MDQPAQSDCEVVAVAATTPPLWVSQWFGQQTCEARLSIEGQLSVHVLKSGGWALLTSRVAGAAAADPRQFEDLARRAYQAIIDRWPRSSSGQRFGPARIWNFIPGIHDPCDRGLDRYMVFNRARFAALKSWLGQDPRKGGLLPTATGVGHEGSDLVISCLATDQLVAPVENPRQRPAYQYSTRYGPLPPCFARAGVWRWGDGCTGRLAVFVGGTASVLGEVSMHRGNLIAQLRETMANLAAVIHRARLDPGADKSSQAATPGEGAESLSQLGLLTQVRAYYPRPGDAQAITRIVLKNMPRAQRIELCQAQLCRQELLVEIEGLACASPMGREPTGSWPAGGSAFL